MLSMTCVEIVAESCPAQLWCPKAVRFFITETRTKDSIIICNQITKKKQDGWGDSSLLLRFLTSGGVSVCSPTKSGGRGSAWQVLFPWLMGAVIIGISEGPLLGSFCHQLKVYRQYRRILM